MSNVVAVIVSYNPEPRAISNLVNVLLPQVDKLVVVDNGSEKEIRDWVVQPQSDNVEFIPLGENAGIATAQNLGISYARQLDARYVLLLDQDSEPAPDMVERLAEAADRMADQGLRVAGVGARYLDVRAQNPPPFIRFEGLKMVRCKCEGTESVVPVDYLISSGCLIPMIALNEVGGMLDHLFIDYVDIEWGLRAKSKGYQCFGACAAKMRHNLGERPIPFLGRMRPVHTPMRHYYHFRNAVWLYRQNWPPLHWKVVDCFRLSLRYGFYALFARPRLRHWVMMTTGIWHGMIGRMGRMSG